MPSRFEVFMPSHFEHISSAISALKCHCSAFQGHCGIPYGSRRFDLQCRSVPCVRACFCGILAGKAPASYRNVLPKLLRILSGAFSYARTHPTVCRYESFLPSYAIRMFSCCPKCNCTRKCTAKCAAETLVAVGLSLYQY